MGKSARAFGGEVMTEDELRFSPGDIIEKRKHHNTFYYFIADVAERSGRMKYRYFLYGGEVFENHQSSGWESAEYINAIIDKELGGWTDRSMASFHPQGHITEYNPILFTDQETHYTLDYDKMRRLQSEGPHVIRGGWLFYETTGGERAARVHNVGWRNDRLADDMLRLSYTYQTQTWVDHEANVMEAANRGLWVPIKVTEKHIVDRKVTEI